MKLARLAAFALLFLLAAASPTRAGLITFTFTGIGDDDQFITAAGSGSIGFAGNSTSLTLANVTSFSFEQTTTSNDPALEFVGTFTYGLADLTAFTATVGASGLFTALTLRTGAEPDPIGFLVPMSFGIRTIRANGAATYVDTDFTDAVVVGAITQSIPVPEPRSLALAWVGLLVGVAGPVLRRARDRRRASAGA